MSAVDEAIAAMQGLKDAHERLKALQADKTSTNARVKELDSLIADAKDELDAAKAEAKRAVNEAL